MKKDAKMMPRDNAADTEPSPEPEGELAIS